MEKSPANLANVKANWKFEYYKLFLTENLSMDVLEIGCLNHPEISEYSFKLIIS